MFLGKTEDGKGLRYRPEYAEEFVQITYHNSPFTVPVLGPKGEAQTVTLPSGFEVLQEWNPPVFQRRSGGRRGCVRTRGALCHALATGA